MVLGRTQLLQHRQLLTAPPGITQDGMKHMRKRIQWTGGVSRQLARQLDLAAGPAEAAVDRGCVLLWSAHNSACTTGTTKGASLAGLQTLQNLPSTPLHSASTHHGTSSSMQQGCLLPQRCRVASSKTQFMKPCSQLKDTRPVLEEKALCMSQQQKTELQHRKTATQAASWPVITRWHQTGSKATCCELAAGRAAASTQHVVCERLDHPFPPPVQAARWGSEEPADARSPRWDATHLAQNLYTHTTPPPLLERLRPPLAS